MSGVFQNIDPPPPHRPAKVYPSPLVRGEDTLAGWRGGGGQYFGRRQTQLCTLHMQVLCGSHKPCFSLDSALGSQQNFLLLLQAHIKYSRKLIYTYVYVIIGLQVATPAIKSNCQRFFSLCFFPSFPTICHRGDIV
jgi:hypothetical protein